MVEVMVASAVTLVVLGMVTAGVRSIALTSRSNDVTVNRLSSQRTVLSVLRSELEATSISGNRFRITPDNKAITFHRLVGASRAGNDVSGTWSSEIEIALRPGGNLVRVQDSSTTLLATGIRDVSITQPAGTDCFDVVVRGETVADERSLRVYPKN